MKKLSSLRRNKFIARGSLAIVMVLLFTVASAGAVDWPKDVKVISPSPGASVHMVQVGFTQVIEKYTPIKNWIVQPLGGPALWLPLMKQGRCDFANHNGADIINAFFGRGLYKKMGPQAVRTVAAGHDYMFMFWTTPDTGIKNLGRSEGQGRLCCPEGQSDVLGNG